MSTNVVRVRHPSVLGIVSVALVFALTATLLAWSPAPAGAVAGYGDVPRDRYFTNPVQWAVDAGIAEPGACFEPGAAATRGDTAAYLWRMQGEPTPTAAHRFVDVTAGWQQDPVSWLYATGITTGTSPTTFGPGETLNRGQFAAFLWRLAGEPTPTTAHRFVDVTAGWQQDPVSWLYATGITTGTSPTTFAPNETMNRGQLVTFLYRYNNSPTVTVNLYTPHCDPSDTEEPATMLIDVHVFYCVPPNAGFTDADLEAEVERLGREVGGFFLRESSGTTGLNFIPGGIVSPDIEWDRLQISDHLGGDPCPPEVEKLGEFPEALILWHASPGGGQAGYASEDVAIVPTVEAYGNPTTQSLTTAHELGHSVFGLDHSSPYLSIMPQGPWFSLEENRLGCDELWKLGWPIHDQCRLGQLGPPAGKFTAITANLYHFCGLRPDGTAYCWGRNFQEPLDAPDGRFTEITTGLFHSCGLRENDTVECWGRDHFGQAAAPAGSFSAISAGNSHTCAIRIEGTIECWGDNRFKAASPPVGRFSAIASGPHHSCGLRSSGAIQCWGLSAGGQAATPAGSFTAITAGDNHSCALRTDGTIQCWGTDEDRYGNRHGALENLPEGKFNAITAGIRHSCGLRDNGTVECWGSGSGVQHDAPNDVFTSINAGGHHTCGLSEDRTIRCWGGYYFKGLNVPGELFTTIDAGRSFTCGLRSSGMIVCWGGGAHGSKSAPSGEFTAVAAGHIHACGLRANGTVECWGSNDAGVVSDVPDGRFTAITAGQWFSCGLREDGMVTCWGANQQGQADALSGEFTAIDSEENHACGMRRDGTVECWGGYPGPSDPRRQFTTMTTGGFHDCGLREDGTIECWGSNRYGQLANIPGGRFSAVSAGLFHTCGIRDNGTIKCWGANDNGRGNLIGQLDNIPEGQFTAITAGDYHTCALRENGEVSCWGSQHASA